MHSIKKGLGTGLVLVLVLGAVFLPATASAQAKKCGSVVKKLYFDEGFYKAKVLIVSGSQVTCSEARKIIWKALVAGGYNGGIQGWQCHGFLYSDAEKEKCIRESFRGVREVIKSGPAKPCPSCHASRN